MKTLVYALVIVILGAVSALAQADTPSSEAKLRNDPSFLAPVIVDGDELFVIRGSTALPAAKRAERIQDRIVAAAETVASDALEITIRGGEFGEDILVNGKMVSVTTAADAEYEQMEIDVLAGLQAQAIEAAILKYRENRSQSARIDSALSAVAWSAGFLIVSYLFFTRRRKVSGFVEKLARKRTAQVEAATKSILQRKALTSLINFFVMIFMWACYLILFYYYLSFVLLAFAETRPVAELLLKYVSEPLLGVVRAIVGYLPNLIMLGIIALIARYLIQGIGIFFDNLEQGVFEIADFEKHWIGPTFFLTKILIIVIALVFAYPYIPGSDSRAFQGLTILAGVMVSLGSNTVVSNMMAGLFVIYRRSTNVGDRIQVGDKTGDVVEIKLMETVIKSIKNEMISIPNAQLLNSEVVNFSRKVDGRGILVHTTVGIGYEEPPKKIKAMLIEAAHRTQGLKKNPAPFVLWTQLADYAINYEVNAFTSRGSSLPKIRSDLHENIVDVFNENGTQIMTPSYISDPEVPKIPEAPWDGKLAHSSANQA
ncbi:Miniconductance mechanosensitive channel MscM precursor [Falsiruegeria litorea R37]|uniref:Small-conductance mechanosensitive channel n=1 Tax=Falsiruegeria litorea R37 TaxID=1200284 RepID=A0A1Y5SFT9_9RHOB|nr:mechanosensitive ion channel family protein [Falsiruegeria litorea]SLN38598.1 Miniconductance mechanosensitive channel MscM precursor [Falsiruegeria litorea R37]